MIMIRIEYGAFGLQNWGHVANVFRRGKRKNERKKTLETRDGDMYERIAPEK